MAVTAAARCEASALAVVSSAAGLSLAAGRRLLEHGGCFLARIACPPAQLQGLLACAPSGIARLRSSPSQWQGSLAGDRLLKGRCPGHRTRRRKQPTGRSQHACLRPRFGCHSGGVGLCCCFVVAGGVCVSVELGCTGLRRILRRGVYGRLAVRRSESPRT